MSTMPPTGPGPEPSPSRVFAPPTGLYNDPLSPPLQPPPFQPPPQRPRSNLPWVIGGVVGVLLLLCCIVAVVAGVLISHRRRPESRGRLLRGNPGPRLESRLRLPRPPDAVGHLDRRPPAHLDRPRNRERPNRRLHRDQHQREHQQWPDHRHHHRHPALRLRHQRNQDHPHGQRRRRMEALRAAVRQGACILPRLCQSPF
jgi:hypothetical protein